MGVLAVIKAWVTPPAEAVQQRKQIDQRIAQTEARARDVEARIARLDARRRLRERAARDNDP